MNVATLILQLQQMAQPLEEKLAEAIRERDGARELQEITEQSAIAQMQSSQFTINGLKAELARERERVAEAEAKAEQIRATAPHGWKCFHCGESFANPNLAKAHFGGDPESKTACVIAKDRELIYQLREAQERATTAEQCLRGTEERLGVIASDLYQRFKGANTVEDAFHLYDSMEGRAFVAEERAETAESELAHLRTWQVQQTERCREIGVATGAPNPEFAPAAICGQIADSLAMLKAEAAKVLDLVISCGDPGTCFAEVKRFRNLLLTTKETPQ